MDEEHLSAEVLKGMNDLRQNLLTITPMLQPIYEWGQGQKAALSADGWSNGAAEDIATEAVKSMMKMAFAAVSGR